MFFFSYLYSYWEKITTYMTLFGKGVQVKQIPPKTFLCARCVADKQDLKLDVESFFMHWPRKKAVILVLLAL